MVPAPPREQNRYRHYTEDHVATLRLASGLRRLGVPLDEVAVILGVAHDGTCSEVREGMVAIFSKVLAELDRQLSEMTEVRAKLAGILDGLKQMRTNDVAVPGVRACRCVLMVTNA